MRLHGHFLGLDLIDDLTVGVGSNKFTWTDSDPGDWSRVKHWLNDRFGRLACPTPAPAGLRHCRASWIGIGTDRFGGWLADDRTRNRVDGKVVVIPLIRAINSQAVVELVQDTIDGFLTRLGYSLRAPAPLGRDKDQGHKRQISRHPPYGDARHR
jgi:hypothetical protein